MHHDGKPALMPRVRDHLILALLLKVKRLRMAKNVKASISRDQRESRALLLLRTHFEIFILLYQVQVTEIPRFVCTTLMISTLFNSGLLTIMDQCSYQDDKCFLSYTEKQPLLSHEGIASQRQQASFNRWPLILLGLNCTSLLIHTILLVLGYSDQKCFAHASEVLLPSHGQSDS